MTKLYIATPMYGGQCTGYYTRSMLGAVPALFYADIPVTTRFVFNESLITRARNSLAHLFMQSDATHLLFIDADIEFNPNDIVEMIKADKDIICGIYPKKVINWNSVSAAAERGVKGGDLNKYTGLFVAQLLDDGQDVEVRMDTPFEISKGGTGFMMIKREVFEGLADKVKTYANDVAEAGLGKYGEEIKEFFYTEIADGRLYSEDYQFCRLARENGFKIYAAPWVKLGHFGTYLYEGEIVGS